LTAEMAAAQSEGQVSIRLLGGFGPLTGNHMTVELDREKPLKEFLDGLAEEYGLDLNGFGSYFLALIDGVEAGLLGGLEAKVRPGCELLLIRISHGG